MSLFVLVVWFFLTRQPSLSATSGVVSCEHLAWNSTERNHGRREGAKNTQGNCHDPERILEQI
jgi:hypothetical protein